MPPYALAHARVERAHHLRTFRGRRSLLEALSSADRARGRFTLVVGGPGAGKSALLAKLSFELDAPFHFIGSHRDPLRFIPALIAQTLAAAGGSSAVGAHEPPTKDDLRNELGAAMELLVRATGRAVVVIDGVDELAEPAALLQFLPTRLVDGAEIILSARSDLRLLTTLRTRVEPLHVVTLAPMVREDLGEETRLPAAELELLIRETSGLPLLLMPALARAESAGKVDHEAIATTAERLFEGMLLEVKTRGGAETEAEAEAFLGVLAVAREPIDLAMISSVLVAQEQRSTAAGGIPPCRQLLEAASRALELGDDGTIRLWHASFGEFLRERVLGEPGVRRVHRAFSAVCSSRREAPYALRHAVPHLAGANDVLAARALASRAERVALQLAANLLPELLADLAYADSPLADIVRRHSAFLLAQPTEHARALATALTFEGTAPDAPSGPWLRVTHRDAPQRALPTQVLRDNTAEVLAIAIHEHAEGGILASASADGMVRVFDCATGKQSLAVRLTERRALAVAFSPDGSLLACGTDDGPFILSPRGGSSVPSLSLFGGPPIWGLAWRTDATLVAGARDGTLTILSRGGEVRWRGLVPHPLTALTADGDHRLFVCGGRGGFTVLDAPEGFVEGRPVSTTRVDADFERPIWAIGSRAGHIVVARHDGKLQLFDRAGGELSTYEAPNEALFAVALHPSESLIACAGTSGRVHLLNLEGDALRELASWKAHDGWVNTLAWRGNELWSAGTDGTIRSHAARSRSLELTSDESHAKPNVVAYSPRGDTLAVGCFDGTLELRAADDRAPSVKLQAFPRAITAIAFATRMIGVGSSEGALALFRLHTDPKTHTLALEWLTSLAGHEAEITCVRFLGNGPHQGLFATASRDHRVCIFSAVGRRLVASVLLESSVVSINESDDGSALVVRLRSGDELALSLPALEPTMLTPPKRAARLVSGSDSGSRELGVAAFECAAFGADGAVLARAPFVFKAAATAPRDREGRPEWTCVTEDGLVTIVLER